MAPKRAATSPLPSRRTPRKSAGKTPERLGQGDGFGEGPAAAPLIVDKDAKEKAEAEKMKAREAAVAKQNKADAAKKSMMTKMSASYKSFTKKKPKLAASLQTSLFNGVGDIVASTLKGTPIVPMRLAAFFLWGALLAQIISPYLAFLNKKKLSKSKVLDSLLKVAGDQLTISPLITALFLVYFKLVQGASLAGVLPELQAEFTGRYAMTAAFWGSVNFGNFTLMPPGSQLFVVNVAGFIWGIVAAYTI